MSHVTSKKVIQIVLAVLAIGFLAMIFASCTSSRGCNGSSKMIGYGASTKQALKNNR